MRVSIILIGLGLVLGVVLRAGTVPAQTDPSCGDLNDDGSFDIVDSVVLRRALAGLGPGITQECIGLLPATGQMTCWDSGGFVVPCAGTGHDGEIQAGAALSYVDNGDGTITDVNTGLMWEKLSDDGSIHDLDDRYTWSAAFEVKVALLNATAFAGHTDWRVPNQKELFSILDLETLFPSLSPAFNNGCTSGCTVATCSCTALPSFFWSSTSTASDTALAWAVTFDDGSVANGFKGSAQSVRAVRGGL